MANALPRRVALVLLVLLAHAAAYGADRLPALKVDPAAISVSGFSSGGFMAAQFQIAFSRTVMGAGVVAGGPYDCAQDELHTAASICSCTIPPCLPLVPGTVERFVDATAIRAAMKLIDPTQYLARQRVWVYRGAADTIIPEATLDALIDYYSRFIPAGSVQLARLAGAEHAVPTEAFGNPCPFLGNPYINDCAFGGAHALLEWIYGPLRPPNGGALTGATLAFDQGEFIASPRENSMAEIGWVYVPKSCASGAVCRLHVAFHGCKQYQSYVYGGRRFGRTFVDHAGYKETADTNNIIVLFPQATTLTYLATPFLPNPNGCWDWWGYTNAHYADKTGPQMAAVKGMVDRIAGGP